MVAEVVVVVVAVAVAYNWPHIRLVARRSVVL